MFDTIIVGAGSSGAALAARLTEDSGHSVLLLEAGRDFAELEELAEELRFVYSPPGLPARNLWAPAFGLDSPYGWGYQARRTSRAEEMFLPRGKVIGGSGSVNCGIFLRGVPEDFDAWAAQGNELWSYESLLPYFCKSERDRDFSDRHHGGEGPIPVWRYPRSTWTIENQAFYEVSRAAGHDDRPDLNSPRGSGVGSLPHNNVQDVRWSSALAYLQPARTRPNLTIMSDALVHSLVFDGRRVIGVRVEHNGKSVEYLAGETIACGGVIGSPHLLLRSGLGPASELEAVGVRPVLDLPGVGKNLRDHPVVPVFVRTKKQVPIDWRNPRMNVALTYTATGSPYRNDMILFPSLNATVKGVCDPEAPPLGFYMVSQVLGSVGTGHVRLRSGDARVQPDIDFNYLAEEFDRVRLRQGVRLAREMLQAPPLAELVEQTLFPSDADFASDEALDLRMLHAVTTSHHSTGTCKMGPASDNCAVVDQMGRVHGVQGLRVVDCSIMPDMIRANPNATTVALAERMAALIRA